MKKITKEQRYQLLALHYSRILPVAAVIILIVLLTMACFVTYHQKERQIRAEKEKSQQISQRLNALEVKVQDLQYTKTPPTDVPLSPIQFRKIEGSSKWQIYDTDYTIGLIEADIAITPRVVKAQGNLYYIGVYSDINGNLSPITIFELSRPINILKKVWETPEELISSLKIFDINIANRFLLYQSGTSLVIYDFYKNIQVQKIDLTAVLGKNYDINNALFDVSAKQIAFSLVKISADPTVKDASQLYIIDLNTLKVQKQDNFPTNKNCVLQSFINDPSWSCQ